MEYLHLKDDVLCKLLVLLHSRIFVTVPHPTDCGWLLQFHQGLLCKSAPMCCGNGQHCHRGTIWSTQLLSISAQRQGDGGCLPTLDNPDLLVLMG
jgi:hypothetical protein